MTSLPPISPNSSATPQVIFLLRIHSGSFDNGFSATLDILEPGRLNPQQKYQLSPQAELPKAYRIWQESYSALGNSTRTIQPVAGQTIQGSYAEKQSNCKKNTVHFEDICSEWFEQPNFEALRRSVVTAVELRKLEQVPILLDACTPNSIDNTLLRKLPWHIWSLFEEDYVDQNSFLMRLLRLLTIKSLHLSTFLLFLEVSRVGFSSMEIWTR